ncbi:MAG TPA: GNAT family N-acetyltransferase, partial [Eoetvoesiella sp.]
ESLAELLKKNRIRNKLTFSHIAEDMRPFLWHGMRVEPQFTYHIGLDGWRNSIDPSALNRARKARSLGYTCEVSSAYGDVCECLKSAEERKQFKHLVSAEELKNLAQQMEENLICFLVRDADGAIKGASICLYTDGHVMDWSAAVKTEALQEGANNILVEFLLDYFNQKGCRTFDFVGANIPPVARMKEFWGGELITYYSIRQIGFREIARTTYHVAKALFPHKRAGQR